MKTSLNKKVGLASLILGASGGLALAQINIVDGSPLSGATGASSAGLSFTVSPTATVLVINAHARENTTGNVDPLPSSLAWNFDTVADAGDANSQASTYGWSDIYYEYNPTPGSGSITLSVPGASEVEVQAFTLSGVNLNVAPTFYGVGGGGGQSLTSLTANLTGDYQPGEWAAVDSYVGAASSGLSYTSSSGTPNSVLVHYLSDIAFGYVSNLAGTSSDSITAATTGGVGGKMDFAALVFEPSAVPEPSSGLLFGAGSALFGLISLIRRKIS